jgi:hypothetical protein
MMKIKWYEESLGVISSKRIGGGICLSIGISMKIVIFVFSLFTTLGDANMASTQSDWILMAGSALLGITGLDVFRRGG